MRPGETAIVLTEAAIRAHYAEAFLLAARDLGAERFQIGVPLRLASDSRSLIGRTSIAGNLR